MLYMHTSADIGHERTSPHAFFHLPAATNALYEQYAQSYFAVKMPLYVRCNLFCTHCTRRDSGYFFTHFLLQRIKKTKSLIGQDPKGTATGQATGTLWQERTMSGAYKVSSSKRKG